MPQIEIQHVKKYFTNDQKRIAAVDDVSLSIEKGEFVFIIGSSGAGKTTLLRLLANQIPADDGRIWVDNLEVTRLRSWHRAAYRRMIGQVWQDASLVRKKTIRQNLELVQRALGVKSKVIPTHTSKALSIVGMRAMEDRYPFELSGGQVKMVELARAIVCKPPILLVDEITANLDYDTGWDIMNILNEINRCGTTVIMATHAKDFVNIMCRRVITLVAGKVAGDVEKGKYGELRATSRFE
ncbi:MAG TPA: ATP-binding cassette domain-containing protein [Candidatus Agathobaculum intestinipullorum]|nr:ATP-binding cassette domain-containing protein [Candidatus Agathobaculum intestinipullorum]